MWQDKIVPTQEDIEWPLATCNIQVHFRNTTCYLSKWWTVQEQDDPILLTQSHPYCIVDISVSGNSSTVLQDLLRPGGVLHISLQIQESSTQNAQQTYKRLNHPNVPIRLQNSQPLEASKNLEDRGKKNSPNCWWNRHLHPAFTQPRWL